MSLLLNIIFLQRVKDIKSGEDSSFPRELVQANGSLFFQANDGANGAELWKSDGTEIGTILVANIGPGSENSNPEKLFANGATVYFAADDSVAGKELWFT